MKSTTYPLLLVAMVSIPACGRAPNVEDAVATPMPSAVVDSESVTNEPNSPPEVDVVGVAEVEPTADAPDAEVAEVVADETVDATTTERATAWLKSMMDDAGAMSSDAASETATWVTSLYESAKDKGETTASDARNWVSDDLARIGTWKYTTVEMPDGDPTEFMEEMNRLGSERWECFWVDKQESKTIFFFKKPGRSYLSRIPARDIMRVVPLLGGGDSDE